MSGLVTPSMKDSKHVKETMTVRVWNVPQKNGSICRVATIEQKGRSDAKCEGCDAPCCRGFLHPVLTEEEFLGKKFEADFSEVPEWIKSQVPRAEYVATLKMGNDGCNYYDWDTHKCKIYPNCPSACLSYSCREDDRVGQYRKIEKQMKESLRII